MPAGRMELPPGFDGLFDAVYLVNAHIVHEHDVASIQSRSEELLDVGLEYIAVHCAFAHKGRGNAVVPQRRDEGKGLPVPVQHDHLRVKL